MKITFAGCGGAFTTQQYYQSNMLLEGVTGKRLLLDCGTDSRFSLGELGVTNGNIAEMIDSVYISHLHADHIGGMEWLGFCTYFSQSKKKLKLYIVETLVDDLWDSLKGGMRSHEGVCLRLNSFFDVHTIPENESFDWDGNRFQPIQTIHIMDGFRVVPSYGLLIEDEHNKSTFITTDTQFCPRQIERFYDRSQLIFQDCETYPFRSNVHAHYDDLKTLPEKTKKKMWLYHYAPNPPQDAVADGFAGFVTKGQVFNTLLS